MRIVNFYCDHCGKKIKREEDVNAVEILFDVGYRPTAIHLCNDCVKELKKFITVDISSILKEEV